MEKKTFPAPLIFEALAAIDSGAHPADAIHKGYSGRSMYGQTCDGFTVSDMSVTVRMMFMLGRLVEDHAVHAGLTPDQLEEKTMELLAAMRTDRDRKSVV